MNGEAPSSPRNATGALNDAAQQVKQLAMHRFVAAADRAGLEEVVFTVGAADESSSFPNEKRTRGNVPGVQASLPEGVEPARGDISEVERGAAHPPHIDDPRHDGRKLSLESRMLRRLAKMGNAAAENGLRQVAAPRDSQPAIAAKGPLALLCDIHVVVGRIVDNASDDLPFALQRD